VLPRVFANGRLTVGLALEGYTHGVKTKSKHKSTSKSKKHGGGGGGGGGGGDGGDGGDGGRSAKNDVRVKLTVRRRDTWWARVRVWRGVFVKFGSRIRTSPRGGLALGFPHAELHLEYDPERVDAGDRIRYWDDLGRGGGYARPNTGEGAARGAGARGVRAAAKAQQQLQRLQQRQREREEALSLKQRRQEESTVQRQREEKQRGEARAEQEGRARQDREARVERDEEHARTLNSKP